MRRTSQIFACLLAIVTLSIIPFQQSFAQYRSRQQQQQPGGLLGAILQAGAQSHARKSWEALPPGLQECMGRALSAQGTSIEALTNQGVSANDPRIAVYTNRCQTLIGRELKQDFECTLVEGGASFNTRCNEIYSVSTGSQLRAISREQYILFGLRGERVSVSQLETHDAMQARVENDAKKRADLEAERQKEEAAAAAAAEKQAALAAAASQREADAARKQQAAAEAQIKQSFAQNDARIQLSRRACTIKQPGTLSKLLEGGNEHDVLSGLLNTSTPPLSAYKNFVAWWPKSSDRQGLSVALHDRIDYDSKRWGSSIARSGKGDYSWDTLKAAMATFAASCLWQPHDQLGVGAALSISPSAVAIASGRQKPTSDADRVTAQILSSIPSNQYFNH